jgi:hypothetical protein
MSNNQKAVTANKREEEEDQVPRLSEKKEKRDRVIRIRAYNYDRLARLGTISEDWDDALTKVLDFWDKHHKEE